jgi:signal transduction histidine kinase
MENNTKTLSEKDPRWRSEVLTFFTKSNYQEALPRVLRYLEELENECPDIWTEKVPSDFATIYYTIAASAYGILDNLNDNNEECWHIFFDHFTKYIETIKNSDKKGLYPKNAETLLEDALDLLIRFQPEQLDAQAKHRVSQMLAAWDDKLALSVLLKKVFDERMDFKHKDGMTYTRILAVLYLELAEGFGERYRSERATVMNILSDLTYFEGKENSEDKALEWIEESLKLNPNDEFAKGRKKNIHDSLVTKEQIRRFNHDANNEIGGMTSNLKKLQSLLESASISPQCLDYLQRINNGMQRMAAVRRFVRKQQPEFKSIDIVSAIIKPLTDSYKERIKIIRINPETPLDWEVDEDYLRLAISNLMKNSAEAFERKQITPQHRQLDIILKPSPTRLEIIFRDNAGGIDDKLRGRIFEPYTSSKGVQKNTGLGLSNARSEIELMKGSLQLASEQPENGTEFIINLTQ